MRLRAGVLNDHEFDRATHSVQDLMSCELQVCDVAGLSSAEIKAKVTRLKRSVGLDMIVVDHLALMKGDNRLQRREAVGQNVRDLKALAKQLNVPMLCLAQLNRAVEARSGNEPQMSDLAESGDIEQTADVILFIYNQEDGVAGRRATIKIGKCRNGRVGLLDLTYRKEMNRFDSYYRG